MRHRKSRRSILSDDEVQALTEGLRDAMGPSFVDQLRRYGVDPAEHFRFMAVASRVAARREAKAFDIKTVAAQLKVARYRVRDIEKGNVRKVVPGILADYVDLLGLKTWFGRWKKKNPELVARIGL